MLLAMNRIAAQETGFGLIPMLLIHWPEFLLNVSVLMMLGGATFFRTGLVSASPATECWRCPDRSGVVRVYLPS